MFFNKVVREWLIKRVTSEHNSVSEGIRHADPKTLGSESSRIYLEKRCSSQRK